MAFTQVKPSATKTQMKHIPLVLATVTHLNVVIDTIALKNLLLTYPQIQMDIAQWLVLNLYHVRVMTSRCENVGLQDYYVGIVHHSVAICSAFAPTLRHAG